MNAGIDENGVRSLIGILDSDGATIIPVMADPATHHLKTSPGDGGADLGPTNALKDENDCSTLLCVSSADGKTPVPIYVNSAGALLISK